MRESTRRAVAAMLLVLFVAFAAGNSLFVHTHVGPQGAVTHSHPFLPSAGHGHAAADFATIASLNAQCYDDAVATSPAMEAPACAAGRLSPARVEARLCAVAVSGRLLRAPPKCA